MHNIFWKIKKKKIVKTNRYSNEVSRTQHKQEKVCNFIPLFIPNEKQHAGEYSTRAHPLKIHIRIDKYLIIPLYVYVKIQHLYIQKEGKVNNCAGNIKNNKRNKNSGDV